jgi:WD repeat-containing protein 48
VLSDKRHVLTKDSNGHVQLWDVLAGQPIQQLGQVNSCIHLYSNFTTSMHG